MESKELSRVFKRTCVGGNVYDDHLGIDIDSNRNLPRRPQSSQVFHSFILTSALSRSYLALTCFNRFLACLIKYAFLRLHFIGLVKQYTLNTINSSEKTSEKVRYLYSQHVKSSFA